jgi:hypothetical protein
MRVPGSNFGATSDVCPAADRAPAATRSIVMSNADRVMIVIPCYPLYRSKLLSDEAQYERL